MLTKSEKQFLESIPDGLKDFYKDQILENRKKEMKNAPGQVLPYVIWLPEWRCVSYNEYRGSENVKFIEAAMKEKAKTWLILAGMAIVFRKKEKREIIFHRIWPKGGQAMDENNYITPLKMMQDVIVSYGHLYDDKPKWCKAYYPQKKCDDPNEWGLKITIRKVENGTG